MEKWLNGCFIRTDEFIVSMLTRKLRDCTVIMIAHQLKMVMGMDRIMVSQLVHNNNNNNY